MRGNKISKMILELRRLKATLSDILYNTIHLVKHSNGCLGSQKYLSDHNVFSKYF